MRRNAASGHLLDAWVRLPARERIMFSLLFYEGLTPTEAARALGCPVREVVRTVQGRLTRWRRLVPRVAAMRSVSARPRRRTTAISRRRAA